MALKEYEVQINGLPHTLQLSDKDAEQYEEQGAKLVKRETKAPTKKAATPANKAAAPANKADAPEVK